MKGPAARAPQPSRSPRSRPPTLPATLLRDAVARLVATMSLRQAAREIGFSPNALRNFLAGAEPRAATRALREAPFAVQFDGLILEGFVDLLIETPDGIEIVYWKTDQIEEKDVPARLKDSEPQASLYVLGVESATGRRVSRVTYVFVSAGVEASPWDPAWLRGKALSVLADERE